MTPGPRPLSCLPQTPEGSQPFAELAKAAALRLDAATVAALDEASAG